LCGTNTLSSVASARLAAVKPFEEVQTQSSFVCLLDSKMVWRCRDREGEETSAVFISIFPPMKWANFILMWANGFWVGEWHNFGRMKFSFAHKWANFWKFAQVTANFTYVWANFLHMGGRIFRVDFGWAIFHTSVGEFLTLIDVAFITSQKMV